MTEQTESRPIVKATPADSGCWIDGHWGQYGGDRVIEIANAHGWGDEQAADLAARHQDWNAPELTEHEFDIKDGAMNDAERWLNDHVAPEGYSFGWFEGEFYLWDDASWEQEYA